MIHSRETIASIQALLTTAGVPQGEVLEEMMDHYLSDIESQIELEKNPSQAIAATFQKIKTTDFSYLKKNRKFPLALVLAPLFFLLLSFYVYQNHSTTEPLEMEEIHPEIAPDGWPLDKELSTVTSKFGMRIHPVSKAFKLHKGIDIKAKLGTPVLATGASVVEETGYSKMAGKYIVLKHNNRFYSRYYHLSSIDVEPHDVLTKGDRIGKVGNTGASLAPHLHYEILDGNAPLDPLRFTRP